MSCILCLKQNIPRNMIDVGESQNGSDIISELISTHLPFQIYKAHDHICKRCRRILTDFHELYYSIQERHPTEFERLDVVIKQEEPHTLFKEEATESIEDNICENDGQQPTVRIVKNKPKLMNDTSRVKIPEFCKLMCRFCPEINFATWAQIAAHYKATHNMNGYVHCNCCDKKFYRKSRLLDHIKLNANPDAFQCSTCNKQFGDREALKSHKFLHLPPEEKPLNCNKCDRTFTHKYILTQHLKLRHATMADKNVKCSDCGKCFLTKAILNNHIRMSHEGVYRKLCDICAKSFNTKLSYEAHFRNMHSSTPSEKIQCKICNKFFKAISMNSHNDICTSKLEKRELACAICHKTYPNAKALSAHKNHVHVKQNNFQCTVCEKAFKRPLALKEHMAGHSGEVLYKCPHCPKTCNNSSNMYQHKKSHLKK